MTPIKILIVHNKSHQSESICNVFSEEENMEVIGCMKSQKVVLQLRKQVHFIIVYHEPVTTDSQSILNQIANLNERHNSTIILMTDTTCRQTLLEFHNAGAMMCIPFENAVTLPHVIKSLSSNHFFIEILKTEYDRIRRENMLLKLSVSEREVLELLENGMKQTEIAQKLYKSENTIRNQISSIIRKLDARTSRQALQKIRCEI